jgi:hypothetical protein
VGHTSTRLFIGHTIVERAKGDVFLNTGEEQLLAGILKDQADAAAIFSSRACGKKSQALTKTLNFCISGFSLPGADGERRRSRRTA